MSLQDEHDIATKRPDVKEAYIKLTDAITGARTSMTAQGKPDRCPMCGSDERGKCNPLPTPAGYEDLCCDDWHSSPVPAAAPQAESVPSGKEWMYGWLNKRPKNPTFSPSQLEVMETMLQDATASLAAELAGSREGHRITGDCLKESLERVAELERSNSLLRERIADTFKQLNTILQSQWHDDVSAKLKQFVADHQKENQ